MKTRDAEALQYVVESGHWRVNPKTGIITTRRDRQGRVTDPEVWRECEFSSQGNRGSARKRIWVNGQRVYSARVVWALTQGLPIPEDKKVDHKNDNSMDNRPVNLQLLDNKENIKKEVDVGRTCWFASKEGVHEFDGVAITRIDTAPGHAVIMYDPQDFTWGLEKIEGVSFRFDPGAPEPKEDTRAWWQVATDWFFDEANKIKRGLVRFWNG